MATLRFASLVGALPAAADAKQAGIGIERWLAAVDGGCDAHLRAQAQALAAASEGRALLAAVFGNSPYLTALAEREPEFSLALFRDGPDSVLAEVMAGVAAAARQAVTGSNPGAALRVAKRRLALATAVADIAGVWTLEQVTGALSDFADAALSCGTGHQLAEAARRGVLTLPDPERPEAGSGLIVLGMGKLGARELNYSSDIDIIVFYDPECMAGTERNSLQKQVDRLTRGVVRLIADRTADGYVFRTDLRLRPDPGATPPAISILAAEAYYETLGQNWERAAMIKARPVAGDRQAGAGFLRWLVPFVWRKNLDFAAIQDIHSIKRQINAHRGGGRIAIEGHNIKLGRGGIREIEFFAQTQQLIFGGRIPTLRVSGTVDALRALARAGKVADDVAESLADAYRFLRRIEHRLQMINDEQTHTLPEDPQRLAALAVFLGYADGEAFRQDLLATLRRVEGFYAELFEDAPALSVNGTLGGNLVFTGSDADPDTLRTLGQLGFAKPETVDATVRGWHHGRCRAMRSTRARELLTELMPILLKALADKPDPDAAFLAFDKFLNALPAGVQLFSMFYAHPDLLQLLAEVLGVAPRLGTQLSRRSSLFDAVLSADFFQPPPPLAELERDLGDTLDRARDAEDVLDLSRRWANDRKFQVGVQSLRGLLDTNQAAAAWSNIAEASLCGLLPRVEAEFARQYGQLCEGGMAIVAMGKLGSREMTAASDLDLIFIYGTPSIEAVSTGERPLPASQYYARLSQRLINAITAQTAEGQLYAVDMRLRPSGKAGPIAVGFETFRRYQMYEAWTWEQMALTRARVVAGSSELVGAITQAIRDVLTKPRDAGLLVSDVAEMRARMAAEHPTESIWDVKHRRGGLIDIEFIAQYLQLLFARDNPSLLSQNTMLALQRIAEGGFLDRQAARTLIDALALWQAVQGRLRLTIDEPITARGEDDAPRALRHAVDGVLGLEFDALVARMQRTAETVHAIFERLIDHPAENLTRSTART